MKKELKELAEKSQDELRTGTPFGNDCYKIKKRFVRKDKGYPAEQV